MYLISTLRNENNLRTKIQDISVDISGSLLELTSSSSRSVEYLVRRSWYYTSSSLALYCYGPLTCFKDDKFFLILCNS